VVRFEIGIALSTNIAPKVDPVLAIGRLQGQASIGRLRLVTLATLVIRLGLGRLWHFEADGKMQTGFECLAHPSS
jgi:hypothetical protein